MTTVLHLVPGLERVGAEIDTVRLACAGLARGQRVLIASAPGPLLAGFAAAGGEHLPWAVGRRHPRAVVHAVALRRLFHRRRIDVLHAHSRLPAWIAWAALHGVPRDRRPAFVTTVHGRNHVSPYSAVMLRAQRVIAVSGFIAAHLRDSYPLLDQGRVRIVPRGIDHADFPTGHRPDARWVAAFAHEFPRAAAAGFRVVLPGRVVRGKGHGDLVEVIADLRARGIDAHGIAAGAHDPRHPQVARDLARRIAERGLEGHVTVTGMRDDLRDLVAHAHAAVSLAHRPESFGLAVLEAACLGVPVVGYDHGGVGEVLRRIQPGGLVPFGDAAAVADRLAAIAAGGGAAPSTAGAFTLDEAAERTFAVYRELLP